MSRFQGPLVLRPGSFPCHGAASFLAPWPGARHSPTVVTQVAADRGAGAVLAATASFQAVLGLFRPRARVAPRASQQSGSALALRSRPIRTEFKSGQVVRGGGMAGLHTRLAQKGRQ